MTAWHDIPAAQLAAFRAQVAQAVIEQNEAQAEAWRSQATWFVDPAGGNDVNDGLTAATALASLDEYIRRMGEGQVNVLQTLTILNDLTLPQGSVSFRATYPNGLIIQGQRTVVRSSALTAVTAWDGPTFTEGNITDSSLADWTADVGDALVMTAGASAGALAWIASDLGGGDTCRFSPMWDNVGFGNVNPTTDTYDIVTFTSITGRLSFDQVGFIQCQDLHLINPGFLGALNCNSGETFFVFCKVTSAGGDIIGSGVEKFSSVTGCNFATPFLQVGDSEVFVSGSMFTANTFVTNGGRWIISEDCLCQGATDPITVLAGGAFEVRAADFLGIFDMPNANDKGIDLQTNAAGFVTGEVFGDGNDAAGQIGIRVDSGAVLAFNVDATDRFGLAGAALTEANIAGTATDYATIGAVGQTVAARLAGIVVGVFG